MRRTAVALTTGLVTTAALLLGPVGAAGAVSTDFGNPCVATGPDSGDTVIMTGRSGANPLPVGAPRTGVVTTVRITLPPAVPTFTTRAKLARPAGAPDTYTILAESAALTVVGGRNTFAVRMPVTTGDLLGLGGPAVLVCASTGSAADTVARTLSDPRPGVSETYESAPSTALPVVATIEPDADQDGFGDETQDRCPQLATVQGPCPVVKVDSFATAAGKKINLVVTTDLSAPVKVTGSAKVGGQKLSLKGGTRTVAPGVLATFTLRLPKGLKAALAALPPGRTIKVTLTASATDSIGRVTTDTTKLKVPGTRR